MYELTNTCEMWDFLCCGQKFLKRNFKLNYIYFEFFKRINIVSQEIIYQELRLLIKVFYQLTVEREFSKNISPSWIEYSVTFIYMNSVNFCSHLIVHTRFRKTVIILMKSPKKLNYPSFLSKISLNVFLSKLK